MASTSRKKARARRKPARKKLKPRQSRRVKHPRTEASPWSVPIKSAPTVEAVFFTPTPKVERLTEHGLESLEKFAAELYSDRKRELRSALDEIWTIRERELSAHDWNQLRELRDDLARRGVTRFVDIVDRVIEILEQR